MPSNNEYKRYFIILQEDDKGYEIASGKVPTGYAKIEIKNGRGKLTAYAQNIKNGDRADYHMLLVAPGKKAAVDMGRIMVDATGRGELNVEFDAENVMKSSMNIADFMVAAVSSNNGIPLSGYTGRDKMQWKNNYTIINKTHDRIDKKLQQIEEVITPVQEKPVPVEIPVEIPVEVPEQMPEMPTMPDIDMGPIVEGVVNVVEGAKDVVGDIVEGAKDVVGDVVEGAKNIVGGVKKGIKEIAEEIMEAEVTPTPVQPAPIPKEAPVTTIPIQTEVTAAPIQPVEIPIIVKPIVEAPPVQPIIMAPKQPIFETETEVKAKFVIETKAEPEPEHHIYVHHEKSEVECKDIDYKNFYYDEESERDSDSDSDSDSDDREKGKEKHYEKDHHSDDHEDYNYNDSPMHRNLKKVLGRLRKYEPFEDEDS
ncbi:MAG: hypothetical protein K0R84_2657, partial [Clostridia bacterium]|nr:hypothetical protein [Clostridia bacterium]